MKFSSIILLGTIGLAAAQKSAKEVIPAGFKSVASALATLDAAITGLQETTDQAKITSQTRDLAAKSDAIVNAINTAAKAISGSTAITALGDATSILKPASDLETATKNSIAKLISKKAIIVKAGQKDAVKANLNKQKTAANGMTAAVVSKMPSIAKKLAQKQGDTIAKDIQKGIDAFV